MILAIAKNRLWNLRHDRAALVLSFVVPVVFFSIFAAIFGRTASRSATRRVRVAVVDEARSGTSRRFVAALRAADALSVLTAPPTPAPAAAPAAKTSSRSPFTPASAEAAVRSGDLPVALLLPKGFGTTPLSGDRPPLVLLSDPSDPVAPQVLS